MSEDCQECGTAMWDLDEDGNCPGVVMTLGIAGRNKTLWRIDVSMRMI